MVFTLGVLRYGNEGLVAGVGFLNLIFVPLLLIVMASALVLTVFALFKGPPVLRKQLATWYTCVFLPVPFLAGYFPETGDLLQMVFLTVASFLSVRWFWAARGSDTTETKA